MVSLILEDNGLSYWKKFVSEYYVPGSKKRWCFSKYENIQQPTVNVFGPKSMVRLNETLYYSIENLYFMYLHVY